MKNFSFDSHSGEDSKLRVQAIIYSVLFSFLMVFFFIGTFVSCTSEISSSEESSSENSWCFSSSNYGYYESSYGEKFYLSPDKVLYNEWESSWDNVGNPGWSVSLDDNHYRKIANYYFYVGHITDGTSSTPVNDYVVSGFQLNEGVLVSVCGQLLFSSSTYSGTFDEAVAVLESIEEPTDNYYSSVSKVSSVNYPVTWLTVSDEPISDEPISYTGYIVPGKYQSTNTTGTVSLLELKSSEIIWNDTVYQIIDGKQWSSFSNGGINQFTYLVKDSTGNKFLCCVMYYINNNKDYVKFYSPKSTDLTEVPESSDYTLVGSLSKALQDIRYSSWEVNYSTPTGGVSVSYSGKDKPIVVNAGGVTWNASFQTRVKNFDLSMPCGESRMEMHVDVGEWLSSTEYSPHLFDTEQGIVFSYMDSPSTAPFYELQCVERYGMYLLSVTKGVLTYDEDSDDYYIEYSILENCTLTKDQFDQLMVHFN